MVDMSNMTSGERGAHFRQQNPLWDQITNILSPRDRNAFFGANQGAPSTLYLDRIMGQKTGTAGLQQQFSTSDYINSLNKAMARAQSPTDRNRLQQAINLVMSHQVATAPKPAEPTPAPKPAPKPKPAPPVRPAAPEKPAAPAIDTAMLDRLEERIMGDNLSRRTGSMQEAQNLRGVFHSTPASEQQRRLTESHRDQFQAGKMSLMADQQSREMQRLQQMQQMLGQSQQQATAQYTGQHANYLNQMNQHQQQQQSWQQLAQPTYQKWGWT